MSNIVLHEFTYEGIPVLEFLPIEQDVKGLVFVQHGYTSDKGNGAFFLAYPLAQLGYKVVSIDAYKHGNRIEEPYISGTELERRRDFFFVVDKTARDIDYLYETYYKEEFPKYDFIGISMGGMIAYRLAMISTSINKLFPTITLPNFADFASQEFNELFPGVEEQHEHLEKIKEFDPSLHPEKLTFQEMHVFNGTNDTVLPIHYTEDFLKGFTRNNVTFRRFEAGHETPDYIQQEIIDYITK